MPQHGFLHQSIAGTYRDAVTAGNAAGFSDRRAAVPEHPRIGVFPVNGERFVHFDVLARFHAAAAKDALVGVVPIKGVGVVHLVLLGAKRNLLVLNTQLCSGVVNNAITVVVIANGAIQNVIAQDPVKSLPLCCSRPSLTRSKHSSPQTLGLRTPARAFRSPRPCRYRRSESGRVAGDSRLERACRQFG